MPNTGFFFSYFRHNISASDIARSLEECPADQPHTWWLFLILLSAKAFQPFSRFHFLYRGRHTLEPTTNALADADLTSEGSNDAIRHTGMAKITNCLSFLITFPLRFTNYDDSAFDYRLGFVESALVSLFKKPFVPSQEFRRFDRLQGQVMGWSMRGQSPASTRRRPRLWL